MKFCDANWNKIKGKLNEKKTKNLNYRDGGFYRI